MWYLINSRTIYRFLIVCKKDDITYHWNVVTSQMRSYMIILVFRRPVGLFMVNCVFVSVIKELEKGVYN